MSNTSCPINTQFHSAVRNAKAFVVQRFTAEGADLNSEAFLARFPFPFVVEINRDRSVDPIRRELVEAAFSDEFRPRTIEAIGIFYANHIGETPEVYLLDMVDDFLNYALPRTLGLPDDDIILDHLYRQFESDLFSESYRLTVVALLENVYDHGGAFHATAGLSFAWADCNLPVGLNTKHLRERAVPFLEIKKTCHPLFSGTNIRENPCFFVLEFQEARKKSAGELAAAYERSEEITRKAIFGLRLLTGAPVYAEYRGFRSLGHYSGGGSGMVLRNYPEDRLDERSSRDIQSCAREFEQLLPALIAAPADTVEVLYDKIDDALRRQTSTRQTRRAARASVDQLLDYFQALEAIIPVEGSYLIALNAAVLLRAANKGPGVTGSDMFSFIKDMHTIRNDVVHGRTNEVLHAKGSTKHRITEIEQFRRYVYQLAILYVLNPDEKGKYGLKSIAHRLALGERIDLKMP